MLSVHYEILHEDNSKRTSKGHKVFKIVFCVVLIVLIWYKTAIKQEYCQSMNEEIDQTLETQSKSINETNTVIITSSERPNTNFTEMLPSVDKDVRPKYFVFTSRCHMPYVDPFAAYVMKIFRPVDYTNCSTVDALISTSYNVTEKRHKIHFNDEVANHSFNTNIKNVHCCYREVVRVEMSTNPDNNFSLLPCQAFHQNFTVPAYIDAIIVNCTEKTTGCLLQMDAFAFIQWRPYRASKDVNSFVHINKSSASDSNDTDNKQLTMAQDVSMPARNKSSLNMTNEEILDTNKPNVLLIGIDSLSRINFRRTMPLTADYLDRNNWFELQGYNKMGDNTFPNLMAILTGLNESTAFNLCKPKEVGGLDYCNFQWAIYQKHGYRTAYAEDLSSIQTFNYLMKGFRKQPTDYYHRPFNLVLDKYMNAIPSSCRGRKHFAEYIYDYLLQYTNVFPNEPIFGLFWTNSFTHNSFNMASTMDAKMLEYFEKLESKEVFETSIVIFLSDHGARFGSLMNLPNAYLEERLPMFFISLPKWFRVKYPKFVHALEVNKNRLTSPYDIYMTLNHILELFEPSFQCTIAAGCPQCQSIFYEMPENRSCDVSGISEHWCTCETYHWISPKSETVKLVANLIIDRINKYLMEWYLSGLCRPLQIFKVQNARFKDHIDQQTLTTFLITFLVYPKFTVFEATVVYNNYTKSAVFDLDAINRLTLYGPDAFCVNERTAKKFCICL